MTGIKIDLRWGPRFCPTFDMLRIRRQKTEWRNELVSLVTYSGWKWRNFYLQIDGSYRSLLHSPWGQKGTRLDVHYDWDDPSSGIQTTVKWMMKKLASAILQQGDGKVPKTRHSRPRRPGPAHNIEGSNIRRTVLSKRKLCPSRTQSRTSFLAMGYQKLYIHCPPSRCCTALCCRAAVAMHTLIILHSIALARSGLVWPGSISFIQYAACMHSNAQSAPGCLGIFMPDIKRLSNRLVGYSLQMQNHGCMKLTHSSIHIHSRFILLSGLIPEFSCRTTILCIHGKKR